MVEFVGAGSTIGLIGRIWRIGVAGKDGSDDSDKSDDLDGVGRSRTGQASSMAGNYWPPSGLIHQVFYP